MCYITQREIEGIIDMTSDMVGDGILPQPLSEKDYYLTYFEECQETGPVMAALLVDNLSEEVKVVIEEKGLSLHHIEMDLLPHGYSIQVYSHGSPLLDEYIVPYDMVDTGAIKIINKTILELVLKDIAAKYPKTVWL